MTRAQRSIVARRLLVTLALALSATACSRGGSQDPMAPSTANDAVFAVISCDNKNADGSCNKWSCKEDELGNCQTFAEACIKNDHHYSGTAKEGTCSRIL
ncbi:MAG TPA: hypothetical protein VL049_25135 [Candidatus Dormibacteraeota bacterium]|nr:hypothetical protein [Candidatus Dormibacteraeota bacterium]